MAIKGKRKGRGRPRGVASAPRPFLVAPRTPPLRRRPVQVFLILLVLGGFAALGAGLRASQDAEQRKQDVQEFAAQVEAAFARSGIVQQFGPNALVLPDLQAAVAELQKPRLDPRNLRADATRSEESAAELAEAISGLDVASAGLKDARETMRHALELYASIARGIGVAASLDADARRALAAPLQQQLQMAGSLFNSGLTKLTQERQLANIPVQPAAPPGLPAP